MYYDHFGLSQPPFKITPDTSLFFPGGNRGAVLEALVYAIVNGEGMVKVVGEVGSGKTMLCRMLEIELPDNTEVVYLANPSLTPDDILYAIAFDLKLDVSADNNRLEVTQRLHEYLVARHADNGRVVIFIEEAQGMPVETLEEIRLLSNLETTQDKLLQIVLFGQPELDENLSAHNIRQLKERITYSFDLTPFAAADIREYVNSRLRASGHRSVDLFTGGAIKQIARHSRGLLRRINILADKSLLAAYAANASQVTHKHVATAARDSEFNAASHDWRWASIAATGLVVVIVTGVIVTGVIVASWAGWRFTLEEEDVPATAAIPPTVTTAVLPAAETAVATVPQLAAVTPTAPPDRPDNSKEIGSVSAKIEEDVPISAPPPPIAAGLLSLESIEPIMTPLVNIDTLKSLSYIPKSAPKR